MAQARRSSWLFGVDLAAQDEAFGANGRVTGTLAGDRVADAGGKAGDLVAALAAEAASPLGHVAGDGLQRAERGFGRLSGADDRLGHLDALLADVDAGPGHELAGLPLRPPAEGTGQVWGKLAAPSPSPPPAGCLDDLVDPLVAEVQGGSEFAQRCAAQRQAADGTVELSLGDPGGMVSLDELFLRLPPAVPRPYRLPQLDDRRTGKLCWHKASPEGGSEMGGIHGPPASAPRMAARMLMPCLRAVSR